MRPDFRRIIPGLFLVLFLFSPALAGIRKFAIIRTEAYNNGKTYGAVGEYERLFGQATGDVDPAMPLNALIQDILLAPRNAAGRVEYVTNFIILKPKDLRRCNGVLFLSLPNRGNVFAPDTALLKRGYIYFWAAWQGDLLPGNNRLILNVPVAKQNGQAITGTVRAEITTGEPAATLPLSAGPFTGLNHHSYPAINTANASLTRRVRERDPRVLVPRDEWAFSDSRTRPFPGLASDSLISVKGGFDPNCIYELIYTAKDPLVLGLGFAAIRDISSFLKYEKEDGAGRPNPLSGTGTVKAALMQGVSQCGNFTRAFLQLGFNQDERMRQVFDGVNDHIGTRRIPLNIRFGRPGGGGMQREDHLYPGNDAPFAWDTQPDPVSGITGGILDACARTHTSPKIVHTLSSTEYWQMRASIRTTDVYGTKDLRLPKNVRIYQFSGTQHGPARRPDIDKVSGFPANDNDFQLYWRAVLVALERWVLAGKRPPASKIPGIRSKTLVEPVPGVGGWPGIPGVPYEGLVNNGGLLTFGPAFDGAMMTGQVTEPPQEDSSKWYKSLVPKMDVDGNELGGLRSVKIRVPLGTYTGWSVRREGFGKGDLNSLTGMFIPFRRTKAERLAAGDPRLSLGERYRDKADYLKQVRKAANKLVEEGFLEPDDMAQVMAEAEAVDVF